MKKYIATALMCVTLLTVTSVAARELSTKEKEVIASVVKGKLKDPDSAKFYWQDYKGGDIYCAHVNSKNTYGGYAGKSLLIIGIKNNSSGEVISAEASIQDSDMMDSICTKRGYSV